MNWERLLCVPGLIQVTLIQEPGLLLVLHLPPVPPALGQTHLGLQEVGKPLWLLGRRGMWRSVLGAGPPLPGCLHALSTP